MLEIEDRNHYITIDLQLDSDGVTPKKDHLHRYDVSDMVEQATHILSENQPTMTLLAQSGYKSPRFKSSSKQSPVGKEEEE